MPRQALGAPKLTRRESNLVLNESIVQDENTLGAAYKRQRKFSEDFQNQKEDMRIVESILIPRQTNCNMQRMGASGVKEDRRGLADPVDAIG